MSDWSAGPDMAYERALAAFQEHSYDVSRQWALETLAQDPSHARARELLARLDAVRRPPQSAPSAPSPRPGSTPRAGASEVVSIDPTVLINRASHGPITEAIDPTIMVRRDDSARRRPDDDPFAALPSRSAAVSDPTVVIDRSQLPLPPPRAPAPPPRRTVAAVGWRERWFGGRGRGRGAAPARARTAGAGSLRGVGVAVGAVAAAALLLFGGIALVHWLWPSGQVLTLTPPTGGTIIGPGLKCGTRGTDCTTTRPAGDSVELTPEPDDGYVYSGFTGDCAPMGRISMTAARTCGATFNRIADAAAPVTFPLTIMKPIGGTIIGAGGGGILCGTNGNTCSANLPSGAPVTLHPDADNGYTFLSFTGDCSPQGDTTMTAGRSCGASFAPTSTPVANVIPRERPMPRPRPAKPADSAPPAAAVVLPPHPVTPPVPPAPSPAPDASVATSTDKAAAPITAEDHAKIEINQLVTNYCLAYQTRDPKQVRTLFPLAPMADLRQQFGEYKYLRCTITSPLKYDRLDASAAGGAQVEFGMKVEHQAQTGGSTDVYEMIVTMVVSRPDFQHKWLIDRIQAVPKPKN
ncbi:MAG: InlB B-repeat-containing protein [Vicinamibacterales bacterium]